MGVEIIRPSDSGRVWYEPDMADLMTGSTVMGGGVGSVTVVTPWAYTGNTVLAASSHSASDNGLREMYVDMMAHSKFLELLDALGTTEDAIKKGQVTLRTLMLPLVLMGGKWGVATVSLGTIGTYATILGCGAGYKTPAATTKFQAQCHNTASDVSGTGADMPLGSMFLLSHTKRNGECLGTSYGIDTVNNRIGTDAVDNASVTEALDHTILLAVGQDGATTGTKTANYRIWFAIDDNELANLPV